VRAIVTGGAGFIGSHLVDQLLIEGWQVTVVDDGSTVDDASNLNPAADVIANCVQHVWLPNGRNADVIFHLAGKVGPVGVLKFAGHIATDTLLAADRAGMWAREMGCPLVFVSTSEVYGSPDDLNSENTPKVFSGQPSARQEYAISKLAAEVMLRNRDIDVRVVRPFNVAGPRQSTRGGFVLPRFVQQALANEDLTVYLPGTQRRAFTHVSDIVEGIMRVNEIGQANDVYNLGNKDNAVSVLQLAEMVVEAVGSGKVSMIDPRTLHGPDFREAPDKIPNSQKATDELAWIPQFGMKDIVLDVIEYESAKWKSR